MPEVTSHSCASFLLARLRENSEATSLSLSPTALAEITMHRYSLSLQNLNAASESLAILSQVLTLVPSWRAPNYSLFSTSRALGHKLHIVFVPFPP